MTIVRKWLGIGLALALAAWVTEAEAADAPPDFPNHTVRIIVPFPPAAPPTCCRGSSRNISASAGTSRSWSRTSPVPAAISARPMSRALRPTATRCSQPARAPGHQPVALQAGIARLQADGNGAGHGARRGAERARCQARLSRQDRTGIDRVCQGQSRKGQLCLARQRLDLASNRHPVSETDRHPDGSHSLSRHDARAAGYHGKPGRSVLRQSRLVAVVAAGRKAAILATGGAKRNPLLPDVPTLEEAGVASFKSSTWFAVVAPAQTPPAIVQFLNREITEVLALPDVKEQFAKIAVEPVGGGWLIPRNFSPVSATNGALWCRVLTSRSSRSRA